MPKKKSPSSPWKLPIVALSGMTAIASALLLAYPHLPLSMTSSVVSAPNAACPEADLQISTDHCGQCGHICTADVQNASGVYCFAAKCTFSECAPGFADADRNRSNGCEQSAAADQNVPDTESSREFSDICGADLRSDPGNCGRCGRICSYRNAEAVCIAGGCAMGDCLPGFSDLNRKAEDGCEFAL